MTSWGVRSLALLALVASYWLVYQHGRTLERAEAGLVSAQRDSGDRLAEVLGERNARAEEQRRAQAQEEARAHAHEERAIADAGAAGADAAGQRLRDEAGKLAATVSCSFSMYLRYSSSVVAPTQCSSPRASAGFSILPASIAPSALPAPSTAASSRSA